MMRLLLKAITEDPIQATAVVATITGATMGALSQFTMTWLGVEYLTALAAFTGASLILTYLPSKSFWSALLSVLFGTVIGSLFGPWIGTKFGVPAFIPAGFIGCFLQLLVPIGIMLVKTAGESAVELVKAVGGALTKRIQEYLGGKRE